MFFVKNLNKEGEKMTVEGEILEHAKNASKTMIRETTRPTCEIPEKQKRMVMDETQILICSVRIGIVNGPDGQPKSFNFNKLNPHKQASLLTSLGALKAIYEGLSGSEEIFETLNEFQTDIFGTL